MPELKTKPKDTMGLRSQKSREALRAALLSELGEKTFQDITVKELTANARIGYATFFRHYEGLDELLVDLASVVNSTYRRRLRIHSPGADAAIYQLCRTTNAIFVYSTRRPRYYPLSEHNDRTAHLVAETS